MLAKLVNTLGDQITFTPSGGQFVNSNLTRAQTSVTCMALIQGDHRTPNPHSYSVTGLRFAAGENQNYTSQGKPGNRTIGLLPTYDSWVYPDTAGPLSRARNRALDRLNERVRGGLDLMPMLGEAGKTGSLIKSLGKFEDWVRRFNPKKLSTTYLEYTYGLKPLLNDIYGALDESIVVLDKGNIRVKAGATESLEPIKEYNVSPWRRTYSYTGAAKAFYRFDLRLSLPRDDFEIARWASLNPVSLAWELGYLSFVVDWFVDVGGYLRNLETGLLYRSNFLSGYECFGHYYDYVGQHRRNYYYWDGKPRDIGFAESSMRKRQFERRVLTSYPLPYKPSISANLGSWQMLNAAALMDAILLKRR